MLDLQVLRFGPGRSRSSVGDGLQELLYVVSGAGLLHVDGEAHEMEPDTAALLLPGESYEVETGTGLQVVAVSAPTVAAVERGHVTVRLADCPEQRADEHRTFHVLHESDVTQFVGIVQPCRALNHSHPYDEVGYILEGRGFAHIGGESRPIGAGSSFHLAPGEVHCIENTGPGPMCILGVFHPAGSPAQRS